MAMSYPPAEQPNRQTPKPERWPWIVSAGVVAAAGIVVTVYLSTRSSGPDWTPQEEAAISVCQAEADEQRDLYGGTTIFEADEITHDGDFYEVSGNTESGNGFGGTVRQVFSCRLESAGNGWRLISLTLLDY